MIKLNEDKEYVELMRKKLEENDGYCPCKKNKTPDTKCMCKEFRDLLKDDSYEGFCHCLLYLKVK